jgi:hypothetical protein
MKTSIKNQASNEDLCVRNVTMGLWVCFQVKGSYGTLLPRLLYLLTPLSFPAYSALLFDNLPPLTDRLLINLF